jgi:hypothetical protein
MSWFPIVAVRDITQNHANELLTKWAHKMGPINRPFASKCFALEADSGPVCVMVHSCLIRPHVGGGLKQLTRENTIELSRLCSSRPGLCRVGLRLWREFIFPNTGYKHAISYQDADLHNGNTYRFDGWQRAGFSVSGNDPRSGLKGRKKHIWVWPPL